MISVFGNENEKNSYEFFLLSTPSSNVADPWTYDFTQ